ncbi:hypothetical protein FO488_17595 [Geobacter sp. FeAm09]|uniref:hypothetical protein n=1 Tax=Geobacter sp. FeAm09 TaxID=2597769 RepID=UPI0011EE3BF9|nr:hypothetical protein [Geobacter sp. FeAm09]QEM69790.1 hypothetical protein FO488_17595 [Geobacter sp. FeAm09]
MTNFSAKRMLGGTGTLLGPSLNTQFNSVVELIEISLPTFAESALQKNISNENGLNSHLTLFISKVARQKDLPFIAQHQSMEDLTRGDSPAPDIGIHLYVDDDAEPPPKITVFEGKRLTSTLGKERRQEYVIGHEKDGKHIPCGGIERFKCAIHGGDFTHAGMIGYIQEETQENWRKSINTWISDLCNQPFEPAWSEEEHLTYQMSDGKVTKSSSLVHRTGSELNLTHLWVNLVLFR